MFRVSGLRLLSAAFAVVALDGTTGCGRASISSKASAHRAAATETTLRYRSANGTLLEHQDHRGLPVGTRIYYSSEHGRGVQQIVYPGAVPSVPLSQRAPDIIIIN